MRTVMHCTADSTADRRSALDDAANLLADATVELEALALVLNGDGAKAARAESAVADELRGLLARGPDGEGAADAPRVEVLTCSNSLENRGVDPEDLVSGVEIVSSGMAELSRRQEEGYAYIRVP